MSSIESLENLKSKMKQVSYQLGSINDKMTTVIQSNQNGMVINNSGYKIDDLTRIKGDLSNQIYQIQNSIIPSIESEIEDLKKEEESLWQDLN